MNPFVTIWTFTYPHELAIIRGKLDSEGIENILQDEMTIQTDPFYSNALGGIKLKVRQSDVEEALEILREAGYLKGDSGTPEGISGLADKVMYSIGNAFSVRFLIYFIFCCLITAIAIYWYIQPTLSEQLAGSRWCVSHVVHGDEDLAPNTTGMRIVMQGYCSEELYLRERGSIILPGFDTNASFGKWSLRDKLLTIELDTSQANHFVFNGTYVVELKGELLTLRSPNTIIYCYKN